MPENKERYTVHLDCPNRTLGLELAYSKRAPFHVTPMNLPATSTEIKKGDFLVGINNWIFDNKTSLDKVLNHVRRNMSEDEPMIKLVLERDIKPSKVNETKEELVDEKLTG